MLLMLENNISKTSAKALVRFELAIINPLDVC